MNKEIQYIIMLLKRTYDGDPWFGLSIKKVVGEVDAKTALQKPNQQHSILELIYHMLNWREFVISRLQPGNDKPIQYFDKNDWRELDHRDESLWKKGLQLLENTQQLLVVLLGNLQDDVLSKQVADREYNYLFLLHGMIQHDIYHSGQIAYVKKLLQ
jgi:uncharacterized damage-inducible protein DinB